MPTGLNLPLNPWFYNNPKNDSFKKIKVRNLLFQRHVFSGGTIFVFFRLFPPSPGTPGKTDGETASFSACFSKGTARFPASTKWSTNLRVLGCREDSKMISKWVGYYNLLINGISWSYNFITHLLTIDPNFRAHPNCFLFRQLPTWRIIPRLGYVGYVTIGIVWNVP